MAVTFNTLFDRLGAVFALAEDAKTQQGTMSTAHAAAVAEYTTDEDMADALIGSLATMQRSLASASFTQVRQVAEKTLIDMMDDDTPLSSKTVSAALDELVQQMVTASESIEDNTVAVSTITYGSGNTGDGLAAADITLPPALIAANSQRLRAETIVATCTTDAQVRGTAGRETFTLTGLAPVSSGMDADWPGGNGVTGTTIKVLDPSQSAGSSPNRNILTNSDFNSFTTDDPDNWSLQTGFDAATDIFEESTIRYKSTNGLRILGDATTTGDIMRQTLNTAGQTLGKLKPNTRYCMTMHHRVSSVPGAGILKFQMTDGSAAVLDSGAAEISVDLTLASSSAWTFDSVFFTTPTALPDGTRAVLNMSTALSAVSAYIGDVACFEPAQVGGAAGPYLAIVRGSDGNDWIRDDTIDIPLTNNDVGKFARFFDMFFDTFGKGKQIPFSASATQADTKIS